MQHDTDIWTPERARDCEGRERKPLILKLSPIRLTRYGRALQQAGAASRRRAERRREPAPFHPGISPLGRALLGIEMASFNDYAENKILNHAYGKEAWTMPTTIAVALCTAVPTDSATGATITEASYTGYARKVVAATALTTASSGEIKNSEALTFAECTAGSSTIIGFAVCDSSTKGAGNAIGWGTITSTVISTTQTPPTIAANGLVGTLD